MANLGNTGQRYKTSKLVSVEVVGNKTKHTLSCGHTYLSGFDTDTPESAEKWANIARKQIGKRQRCNDCVVED